MRQPALFADEANDQPVDIQARAGRGDLWQMGNHFLLVGDSTNEDDVARLIAAAPASPNLLVTDPPYGVNYSPDTQSGRTYSVPGRSRSTRRSGLVTNDDNHDWRAAYALCPAPIAYIWAAGLMPVIPSIEDAGYQIRQQIVWVKDNFVLTWSAYHWQHEVCYYAARPDRLGEGGVKWIGGRAQSTVWRIVSVNSQAAPGYDWHGSDHPTQKPVECFARPIRNHDAPIVIDLFAGSGTIFIAAEREGRSGLGIELEPAYADMALARWEKFTGDKARLIDARP